MSGGCRWGCQQFADGHWGSANSGHPPQGCNTTPGRGEEEEEEKCSRMIYKRVFFLSPLQQREGKRRAAGTGTGLRAHTANSRKGLSPQAACLHFPLPTGTSPSSRAEPAPCCQHPPLLANLGVCWEIGDLSLRGLFPKLAQRWHPPFGPAAPALLQRRRKTKS